MATKKRANPAYRKTTRNGIPVYVSTTTGRVVKGPGLKKTTKRLVGAIKHSLKRTVKRVVKAVKNPTVTTARHFGSLYAQEGHSKQAAWTKFLAWARGASPSIGAMPTDPAQRQTLKRAFMIEWERVQKYHKKNPVKTVPVLYARSRAKNFADNGYTKQEAWDQFLRSIGKFSPYRMPSTISSRQTLKVAFMAAFDKARADYPERARKNPKSRSTTKRKTAAKPKKVGRTSLAPLNGTAVGKSKYKTTMDAAAKLMPFPAVVRATGRKADGEEVAYYLYVKRHNVAAARKVLNAMAKTIAKK